MYYIIDKNNVMISANKQILESYNLPVLDLPEDYEEGKYIISDNELVLNPNWEKEKEEKEKERISRLSLTKREVFLAVYDDKGITPEQLRAQITDVRAGIEFDYAEKYFRFNPLIDSIGLILGYTPQDLDYLFINKKFPPRTEE
jgi:CTP:phosphocholine cytidylyltransferase-like protein